MPRNTPLRIAVMLSAALAVSLVFAQDNDDSHPPGLQRSERLKALQEASQGGQEGVRVLKEALEDEDPEIRAAAVQFLWDSQGEASLETILPLLDDESGAVGLAAARSLLDSDDARAAAGVGKALRTFPTSEKIQLISYLSDRRQARYVEELAGLLSENSVAIRTMTVDALISIGTGECFRPCMAATGDADPTVASYAVNCLETVGDPAALARLAALAESPQPAVRTAVASAIPALGGIASHEAAMRRLLADPVPSVPQTALESMRRHPAPEAVRLVAPLLSHDNPRVRRSVIAALRPNPSREANQLLLKALDDADEFVRAAAAQAVGFRKMDYALDMITGMASDTSPTVRVATAAALGDLGLEAGLKTLELLSTDPDIAVRSAALAAAGNTGGGNAVELARKGLADKETPVRIAAVRALGALDSPAARDALRSAAAGDATTDVRVAAVAELASVNDRETLRVLCALRNDESEFVRSATRNAITTLREAWADAPACSALK